LGLIIELQQLEAYFASVKTPLGAIVGHLESKELILEQIRYILDPWLTQTSGGSMLTL
jgi:hypothetical protein